MNGVEWEWDDDHERHQAARLKRLVRVITGAPTLAASLPASVANVAKSSGGAKEKQVDASASQIASETRETEKFHRRIIVFFLVNHSLPVNLLQVEETAKVEIVTDIEIMTLYACMHDRQQ